MIIEVNGWQHKVDSNGLFLFKGRVRPQNLIVGRVLVFKCGDEVTFCDAKASSWLALSFPIGEVQEQKTRASKFKKRKGYKKTTTNKPALTLAQVLKLIPVGGSSHGPQESQRGVSQRQGVKVQEVRS